MKDNYIKRELSNNGRYEYILDEAMNIDDYLVYARVGKGMYERRGGWAYYKKYKQARKRVYDTGYISWWDYEYTLLAQLVVALLPNKVRGWVFRSLLHR